ncbi:hypothetical protein HPO96_13425 [Kribbella sandramycini]|uniref:Uncharacterized protein n=1 Tax=Kribbella sandramycini TaxID=60450 RepID=A0A7Y4L0C9_9ACTN|nr:hypothetical protein [Kribbella sandramycini]MBB6568907.1 hypothetical protein [Kribbella sandramycini]NOL41247.1 hypothetical protein [Kribbella sandramycini]
MRKVLSVVATAGLVAAGAVAMSAATAVSASASATQGPYCPDSYVDGHGTVWVAKCRSLSPGMNWYQAVTTCSNGQTKYGDWVAIGGYSSAYCSNGSVVGSRLVLESR